MSHDFRVTRRSILKGAAVSAAGLALGCQPDSGWLIDGRPAPGDRIGLGFIGTGKRGQELIQSFASIPDCEIIAVCDCREKARTQAKQLVETETGKTGCADYVDFQELIQRKDIDAVVIATPEHWHALMVLAAIRAGKDVYCETPLTRSITEAIVVADEVRRTGRMVQTGSQQRSMAEFRRACEIVRNNRIGAVKMVYVDVGGPSHYVSLPEEPVEAGLDWDRWLGPAPFSPFNSQRLTSWRMIRDYSGGFVTDEGAHHFDIVQWALNNDNSGPFIITPPDLSEDTDAPVLTFQYLDGVKVRHCFGPGVSRLKLPTNRPLNGILFVGDEGWVEVNRGYLASSPADLSRTPTLPTEDRLAISDSHERDWIKSIRTRMLPIAHAGIGARTATMCHLANIAYWIGRPFRWDALNLTIPGDDQAKRMMDIPMRGTWGLQA